MKILIIRFSSLGDVVMTAGVVESVRRRYPDANVTFLTKRLYVPVFVSDSRIDNVVGIEGSETPPEIRDLLGTHAFDIVIDLHANLRSMFVTSLIKSPVKLRVRKHALARRAMIWSRNRYRHQFDTLGQYVLTLRPLGISERVLPHISPDPLAADEAGHILAGERWHNKSRIVGIAPGAKHETKRWSEKSFASLAESLIDNRDSVVFIGDSNDIGTIDRIRKMMTHNVRSFAGAFDVNGTIGLISKLDCLVCNDSGPMHIAGALGVPFAAIFGPTHPDLGFCPGYLNGEVIHSGVPCSPCSIHGSAPCRLENRECMDGVTPEAVMTTVQCLLSAGDRQES